MIAVKLEWLLRLFDVHDRVDIGIGQLVPSALRVDDVSPFRLPSHQYGRRLFQSQIRIDLVFGQGRGDDVG
ncbi:hypothetical protein D3C81_2154250 [compost metagenome]